MVGKIWRTGIVGSEGREALNIMPVFVMYETFEICVILTQDFEKLDQVDFSIAEISRLTINKLYVALSRTKGNLYLVKKSVFDRVKAKYLKG